MIAGRRKLLAVAVAVICVAALAPYVVSAQGGFDSWRAINMTGVSDSYLTIGMDGVPDSHLTVNSVIVIPELTGVRMFPLSCSFGLLRPGDIRLTEPAFTLYNASNQTVNITIGVSGDWHGPAGNWTHSDECDPGANTAGLRAIIENGPSIIVKKTEPYNELVASFVPGETLDFALEIYAPTEFAEHSKKQNSIFITVSEA